MKNWKGVSKAFVRRCPRGTSFKILQWMYNNKWQTPDENNHIYTVVDFNHFLYIEDNINEGYRYFKWVTVSRGEKFAMYNKEIYKVRCKLAPILF